MKTKVILYTHGSFACVLPFLLLISAPACAQVSPGIQKKVDSLEFLAQQAKLDTASAYYFHKIAALLLRVDPDEALRYEKKSMDFIRLTKDQKRITEATIRLSEYHRKRGDYRAGLTTLQESESENAKLPGQPFKQKIFMNLAATYSEMIEYDSARKWAEASLKAGEGKNDYYLECRARIILGNVFLNWDHNNRAALEQFALAEILSEKCGFVIGGVVSLQNTSNIFARTKQLEKARVYLKKSLALCKAHHLYSYEANVYLMVGMIFSQENKLDSALYNLQRSLELYNSIHDTDLVPDIHQAVGEIYEAQKKFDQAIGEYREMIALDWTDNKYFTALAYAGLARSYAGLQQDKKVRVYLDSGASIANTIKEYSIIVELNKLYYQLYARTGDYRQAYTYHLGYIKLKDSLDAYSKKEELTQVEADFQIKKKEDEIRILNAENKAKDIQLYSLIGFAVLALVLIGLIYSRYKNSVYVRKKLVELDQVKSRFFANISHEFRTPLTLVMGPIKRRLEEAREEKDKKEFSAVYRNANRLHTLIDQLLDLSKIESGKMSISVQSTNIIHLINIVYSYFTLLAESKSMTYTLHCDATGEGFLDRDKIEKIIFNLLSNAFKFTPEGGAIDLYAKITNTKLTVTVTDNGIGIAENKVNHVFDRFYQADDSTTRMYEGSGIGLALSKELATVHKGSLTVISEKEKGSAFTLIVPIDKTSYKNELFAGPPTPDESKQFQVVPGEKNDSILTPFMNDESLPWALVVEDNPDMQQYLASLLENEYRILTASDGEDAWEKILNLVPDIIVCDYMMPNMDGRMFCEKVKQHSLTDHIPVVMVTAKAGLENKLEVLKSGADAFLTKPFDDRELLVTLHNLLSHRKKIMVLPDQPEPETKSEPDTDFISTLKVLIKENYSDSGFGVEQLTDKLGLSKTQFHRKLKAITDKTPAELLRSYRLEKARNLLLIKNAQVSDVAYKVGYRNLSNFTKIFKEYTGQTPSEFMIEQKISAEVR